MKHLKALICYLVLVVLATTWMPARVASSQAAAPAKSSLAAGPWYVAPGGRDTNSCLTPATPCATINAAIGKADLGDTIFVATGTYTNSLGSEVVLIDKSITLSGGWDADFTAQNGFSIIDGGGALLGITVGNSVEVAIERLTVQNGRGGIRSFSSTLAVVNSNMVNNTYVPGDPYNEGGGISNMNGKLDLIDCTVSGNAARSGGGIANSGTMTITNSSISGNTAGQAGFGSNTGGGGIYNQGALILNNSTVSDNIILGEYLGSGILNYPIFGGLNVNNSTISGNINGDGIYAYDFSMVSLNSSTISNNQGHGLSNFGDSAVTLQNTIIANNAGSTRQINLSPIGTCTSLGYNIGQLAGCTLTNTDLVNVDPGLFALMGSPGYHPLLPGSLAIDAGNPASCTDHLGNTLLTDQRGVARLGRCDIGAYEYDPNYDPLTHTYLSSLSNSYCPAVYADDFSDPASGWPIETNDPTYRLEYLNGKYRMLLTEPDHWVVSGPDLIASEYVLSVNAVNTSGVDGTFGFIYAASDDMEQFYTFEMDLGNYYVYRYDSGNWTQLAAAPFGFSFSAGETISLKLERVGAEIRGYVNGQLYASVTDGTYTGPRQVGLIISTYDQANLDVHFDNFALAPGNCAAGAQSSLQAAQGSGENGDEIFTSLGYVSVHQDQKGSGR